MIRVFIDGPIAGDVRTDFPESMGPTVRIHIPPMRTWCDCNPDETTYVEFGPEVVEYHSIAHGPNLAIMSTSSGRGSDALAKAMNRWVQSDLTATVWERNCRDRNAWR